MVYDRKTGEITSEKVYESRALDFLYNSALGGFCRLFLRLPVVSRIKAVSRKRARSAKRIEKFVKDYGIDLDGFEQNYRSFNDFFIRKKLQLNFDGDAGRLISPADSCLLALTVDNGTVFSIKGRDYTLSRFLKDKALAEEYEGGACLIFRLRVYDYHRFCFVDNGSVVSRKRVRGFLDSINTGATGKFTLCSNYREISRLKTENFGDMIAAEVGAMLVGRIVGTHKDENFRRGGEKGYFEFGASTIVLLFKKGVVSIDGDITEHSAKGIETKVDIGEKIGNKIPFNKML